jgi:hypothetical protein
MLGMDDSSLKGKAKELYYWPLVDRGYDLVCMNHDGKRFLAVQVKYQTKGISLDLRKVDCRRFSGRSVFLVAEPV